MSEEYGARESKQHVKFFVSTTADLLTKKVEDWINEMKDKYGIHFWITREITPTLSYTTINNKGAYMIGCSVNYIIPNEEKEETKNEEDTN